MVDVRDYPFFAPRCLGARVRRESPQEIIAELEIGFGPFQENLHEPNHAGSTSARPVRPSEGGPLERLTNAWTFTPTGDKTQVDLVADFQFESRLLDHMANFMFREAATRILGAFESRVHFVHLTRRRQSGHLSF